MFLFLLLKTLCIVVHLQEISMFSIDNVDWSKSLEGSYFGYFGDLDGLSLISCIQECLVMARCQSVNYERRNQMCYLNDNYTSSNPQDMIDRDGHVFINMSSVQNKKIIGKCAGITCPFHERCVISNGSCIPSDCPTPPHIGNASISDGGSLIGNQRYYTCEDGYTAKGDRVVTCGADSKWTRINLECTFTGEQNTRSILPGMHCTKDKVCSDKTSGSVCENGVCNCPRDAEYSFRKCITDCKSIYNYNKNAIDGIYEVSPDGQKKFNVFCDMRGGGWTLIQTREATTEVNFDRPYQDYINTFGNLKGDHWIGLENIRLLTSAKSDLKLDGVTSQSVKGHVIFSNFTVGGPKEFYKLIVDPEFQRFGALSHIHDKTFISKNGRYFTTIDRDMDALGKSNCAVENGAYWHHSCCKLCNVNKSSKNITVKQKDGRDHLILSKVTFKVIRSS